MSDDILKSDPFMHSSQPYLSFAKSEWEKSTGETLLLIFCVDSRIASKLNISDEVIEEIRHEDMEKFLNESHSGTNYYELSEHDGRFERLGGKPKWADL